MSTRVARAAHRSGALVERGEEVALIEATLTEAQRGQGGAVLIEAAPGMGKSRLLERACDLARDAGVRILGARGSELEWSFAFGVVRQLLEGPLTAMDEADRDRMLTGAAGLAAPLLAERRRRPRPGSSPSPEATGLHGLYWLTANLAKQGPLLICVDDAHWADEPSLRWLAYLTRRVIDLPVAVIVATRQVRDGGTAELLASLEQSPATSVAVPDALTAAGTGALAAELLRVAPEEDFVSACHRATAGSPLLLVELLRSLESEALEPTTENVERLFSSGPASLSRAALARLRGLPEGAVALTRAVAILERGSLHAAAELAEIDLDTAERAAQSLIEVGVLADTLPLEFVHPLIRSCVYADISAPQRVSSHLRAARLLDGRGADAERVASHLMQAEPSHEAWVLETLQRASATAWARGAPAIAVGYLRRALVEFPVAERPGDMLLELGRAEVRAGGVQAGIEHFRAAAAAALAEDAARHAQVALELGAALTISGESADAATALVAALRGPGADDREWGLRLQAQLDLATWGDTAARDIATGDPERFEPEFGTPAGVGDRAAMTVAALRHALDHHGFDEAAELARRAQAGELLLKELSADDPLLTTGPTALLYAERLSWAGDMLGQVLASVTKQGSRHGVAAASAWRALASLRAGRLADAELDARQALDVEVELGDGHSTPVALGVLIETLVETGRVDEAELLATTRAALHPRSHGLFDAHLCFGMARLRAAQQRWPDAEAQLRECAALHATWHVSGPAASPWRGHLAIAVAAQGRAGEAEDLALRALNHARGADSLLDLGVALRAAGKVTPSAERRGAFLHDAVSTLRETEARLELGHALAELGSELRRSGARREAWVVLSEALGVTGSCAGGALEARIRSELVVLGAKPRRGLDADRDRLTAAELRVAQLAAQGATNRQVAEDLFVSAKTVEYHLTSIYRKLSISSRRELPAAVARTLTVV